MLLFANPWFLLGLSAVAIPIAIHLFSRQKVQVMDWAAMRFIQDIVEQQQKKMKLEDLLLLVLRCLFVACVALAMSRPALKNLDMPWLGGDGDALVILDDTYSMGTRDGAMSRMERGQQRLAALVQACPEGMGLSLGLGRRDSHFLIDDFSHERALLLEGVKHHQVGPWDGTAESMLRQALDRLMRSSNPAKTLFLISDFQKDQWEAPTTNLKEMLKQAQEDCHLVFLPVGDDQGENIGLGAVEVVGGVIRKDQASVISAEVINHGDEMVQNGVVSLWIGDDMMEQTQLSIAPKQRAMAYFRNTFRESGLVQASVRLDPDGTTADDRVHLACRVQDRLPMLWIHDIEPDGDEFSETAFWEFALNPYEDGEKDPRALYSFKHTSMSQLSNEVLDDFGYVIVNNVTLLNPDEASQLEDYVRAGGRLLFFMSQETDSEVFNAVLHRGGEGLLAYPISGRQRADKDEHLSWELSAKQHPVWSYLVGRGVDHLESWQWSAALSFERRETEGVLEHLSAGPQQDCSAFEVSFGQGKAMFMGWGPGTLNHNLPLTAAWPTFVGQMNAYLLKNFNRDRAMAFGEPWLQAVGMNDAQSSFQLSSPSGDSASATVTEREGRYWLQLEPFDELGVHRIQNSSRDEAPWQVAVNVVPEEGRVACLSLEQLESVYGELGVVVDASPELMKALSSVRSSPDFSWLLLLLACGLMVSEQCLSHRVQKRSMA